MSQGMQKVIKQYEKDNDLVLQFLEEKCERNAEGKTRAYDGSEVAEGTFAEIAESPEGVEGQKD